MGYKNILNRVSISVLSSISKTKTQIGSMQTHVFYIRLALKIHILDHLASHIMGINPAKIDIGCPLHPQCS